MRWEWIVRSIVASWCDSKIKTNIVLSPIPTGIAYVVHVDEQNWCFVNQKGYIAIKVADSFKGLRFVDLQDLF